MTGAAAADRQRPGVFTVDTDRALEALRVTWGNAYAVCFDDAIGIGGGRWQAWRLGGHGARLAGATPGRAERRDPRGLGAREPAVTPRRWLSLMQDELDQVPRLARFRDQHPGVLIREGFGFWQAVIPEPTGETIITRYTLRELLDKLTAS